MKKLAVITVQSFVLLFLFSTSSFVFGQTLTNRPNVNIDANCNGYVEFLPSTYNNNTQNYPLLIFLHGNSQWGPGTDSSLISVRQLGPNYWVDAWLNPASNWIPFPGRADLDKMVMISPQFIGPDFYTNPPTPAQVNDVVDYVCTHYRIDPSRIYMSGPSFGGRWSIEYASPYPYRVAAIIPFAAAIYAEQPKADSISASNLPIWMFNNLYDYTVPPSVTQDWITMFNNPTAPIPAPTPLAYATYPNTNGHIYDDHYRGVDTAFNGLGINMYKWMQQHSRANYFVGDAGTSWENPGNWSYKQVPNDSTVVVINRGPVIINSNASCKKITINPGVTVTVNSGYHLTVKQ